MELYLSGKNLRPNSSGITHVHLLLLVRIEYSKSNTIFLMYIKKITIQSFEFPVDNLASDSKLFGEKSVETKQRVLCE